MEKDKLLRHIDVGGKILRAVEDKDYYYLYEGKKLIYKFVKEYISKKVFWEVVSDYAKYLKQLQNEFIKGDMPIDKLVDEVEKKMKDEFDKRLKKFFKTMQQKNMQTNKEGFFKIDIFPRLDRAFHGFNKFINDMVKDVIGKMHVDVVNDVDDTGVTINQHTKKLLNDKKKLMIKNISQQVKTTKDNVLSSIKKDLSSGMQAGTDSKQIQKDIEKKFNYKNGVAWKTKRTMKTELHDANALMKLKKWHNMGFESAEIIVREDEKTCKICRPKNHKVIKINTLLNNRKTRPTFHPNCRCTVGVYE